MEKDRKYFAFFASFFEAIDECPIEYQRDIYRAITLYGLHHEEMPLEGVAKAIFISIKPALEKGWTKYNNGAGGGAPIGNQNANKNNRITTEQQPNPKQKTTKEKIENKKEIIAESNDSVSISIDAQGESLDYSLLMGYFNSVMEAKTINQIERMTSKRKSAVNARIAEYGKDAVKKVIDKAANSVFLNGGGDRAFIASFDWLFKPNNFIKVLEGNYDNRPRRQTYNGSGTTTEQRLNDAASLISKLTAEGTESDD